MINDKTLVSVTNRTRNMVVYLIPDLNNLRRMFAAGETKNLPFEELKRLSWTPGGDTLLKHSLRINDNEEAIKELFIHCEPEYYYSRVDVEKLLKEGSTDELLDCIDFAPKGVVDMLKDIAVKTELNDMKKREIILEKLGFNVTNAIEINRETSEATETAVKTRRVGAASAETEAKPEGGAVRRVAPQYKVVK